MNGLCRRRASFEKEEFYWVNTTLGNLKCALRRTFYLIKTNQVRRYLAHCQYMYNRRYELGSMIVRRLFRSVKTAAMPERMLRLDEKAVA